MSLLIAISGYLILAVVAIMDKFIVSEEKISPVKFVFYSTVSILPVFFLLPFGVQFLGSNFDYAMSLVSGFTFALALWAMYIGLEKSEVSHTGPLVGAAVALFVLVLGQVFLRESISLQQYIGVLVLALGSLLISFEQSQNHRGWHGGMLWGVVAGLLFAISHVTAKYIYAHYDFYSGFVWPRGFIGVFGVVLLLIPTYFKEILRKKSIVRRAWDTVAKKKASAGHVALIVTDKVLGVVAVVLIQYAIAVGSVTLVNALAGVQYAFLVVVVGLLSAFSPRLFKEEDRRGEMAQEAFAVFIIGVGLALLIV